MKSGYDNVVNIKDYRHTQWNVFRKGFIDGFQGMYDIKFKDLLKFLISKA